MSDAEIKKWLRLTMDHDRAEEAVEHLVQIGEPAVEPIIHWFHIQPQPPENIQWESIPWTDLSGDALIGIGKPALPHLMQWYKRDRSWRNVAVAFMKSIGATPEVLEFLYHEWFRYPYLPRAVQRLTRSLYMNGYTRKEVADIFAKETGTKYQPILLDMLEDHDFVITPVLKGLARHGDRSVIPAIQHVIRKYQDEVGISSPAREGRLAISEIEKRYAL